MIVELEIYLWFTIYELNFIHNDSDMLTHEIPFDKFGSMGISLKIFKILLSQLFSPFVVTIYNLLVQFQYLNYAFE